MCETRWIERHDAILQFKEIFPAIVLFLEEAESLSKNAHILLNSILKFEFIIALVTIAEIFGITVSLSRQLQNPSIDIVQCYGMIERVKDTLKECRENQTFHSVFENAITLAKDVDVEVKVPRITSRQTYRSNIPTTSPENHYRINIFLPFLDYVFN